MGTAVGLEELGSGLADPFNMPKTDILARSYRWRPVGYQRSLEIALKKLIRNNQSLESASKITIAGGNGILDGSFVRNDRWR
jgi:hypothetical protein